MKLLILLALFSGCRTGCSCTVTSTPMCKEKIGGVIELQSRPCKPGERP